MLATTAGDDRSAASVRCSSPTISPIRVDSDVNDALAGLQSNAPALQCAIRVVEKHQSRAYVACSPVLCDREVTRRALEGGLKGRAREQADGRGGVKLDQAEERVAAAYVGRVRQEHGPVRVERLGVVLRSRGAGVSPLESGPRQPHATTFSTLAYRRKRAQACERLEPDLGTLARAKQAIKK